MSHWAPRISQADFDANGNLGISWEVDDFYDDSEAPDDVFGQFGAGNIVELGKNARDTSIAKADLQKYSGQSVAFTVSFKWTGPPDDIKSSAVAVAVPAEFSTPQAPTPPALAVVSIEPKTLQHENQVTISYSSWSFTDGNIDWGESGSGLPNHHSIKPKGTTYSGTFTTDSALRPSALYEFDAAVINSLKDNTWHSSSIQVRSKPNFRSARSFLVASGVPFPARLRASMAGMTLSLRRLLGV